MLAKWRQCTGTCIHIQKNMDASTTAKHKQVLSCCFLCSFLSPLSTPKQKAAWVNGEISTLLKGAVTQNIKYRFTACKDAPIENDLQIARSTVLSCGRLITRVFWKRCIYYLSTWWFWLNFIGELRGLKEKSCMKDRFMHRICFTTDHIRLPCT